MKYEINGDDPKGMTDDQLVSEINGFTKLAEDVAYRMSVLLVEMKRRRLPNPFYHHPILKFFEQIADKTIHPKAAILLGNSELIKAVSNLPHEEQISIAEGKLIPIAEKTETGEIKSDDIPIHRMDKKTITRVFHGCGIRPVHEQAKIIEKTSPEKRFGNVTAVVDEMVLRIGNQKIKPEELVSPLKALGYTLKLSRIG